MLHPLAIASDHAGFALKSALLAHFKQAENLGPYTAESVDYPDFAHIMAGWLADKPEAMGVLICGSGIGISIAANRHAHVRAALCDDVERVKLARQHNNANVLCLPARFVSYEQAEELIEMFLSTPFEGGRHAARIEKMNPL